MLFVQGLTHYVTLCMADSIRRLGMDIAATKEFTSPVYQIELSLVGRLLSQDPDLYADILQRVLTRLCRENAAAAPTDMSRSHLDYEAVQRVLAAGLMGLSASGAFEPWRPVSGREAIDVVDGVARLVGP